MRMFGIYFAFVDLIRRSTIMTQKFSIIKQAKAFQVFPGHQNCVPSDSARGNIQTEQIRCNLGSAPAASNNQIEQATREARLVRRLRYLPKAKFTYTINKIKTIADHSSTINELRIRIRIKSDKNNYNDSNGTMVVK